MRRVAIMVGIALYAATPATAQVASKMPAEVKACENQDGKTAYADVVAACDKIATAPGASAFEIRVATQYKGNAQLAAKDISAGIATYDKAMAAVTDASMRATMLAQRAKALWSAGQRDKAMADMASAIAADPKNFAAYDMRASAYEILGDRRKALADADKANEIRPTAYGLNRTCWWRAAYLNTELDRAQEECLRSLNMDNNTNTWDSRGMVALRAGRVEEALDIYDTVIKRDAKQAGAYYARGLLLIALGRTDEGAASINRAEALNPKIAEQYAGYGLAPGKVRANPAFSSGPRVTYAWGDPKIAERVEDCSSFKYFDVGDFALALRQKSTLAQVDAKWKDRVLESASTQAFCLRGLKSRFPEKAAMIEQAAQTSIRDLRAAAATARAEFLNNPAKQMWAGNIKDYFVADLQASVKRVRDFQTFAQQCPTPDFSMPTRNNSYNDRLWAGVTNWGKCAVNYRDNYVKRYSFWDHSRLENTREELDSFLPFTCSRYRQAGCIEDDRWRELDRIASVENIAIAKRVDDSRYPQERRANDAVGEVNQYYTNFNAMIARLNASR